MNTVLLHTCCAPCSLSCIAPLRAEGIEPVAFWYNPNIHPWKEYQARRDCLLEYAPTIGMEVRVREDYGLKEFVRHVAGDIDHRCAYCYQHRLEGAAQYAAEHGFPAFTTTLLASLYQDHDGIVRAAEQYARQYGVEFLLSLIHISAGLSISVVKNAIYKVIRAASPEELGRSVVVQGGTFYNEAVLRAFEKEMGVEVIRPDIAGLMGAYGAALYGISRAGEGHVSTLLSRQALADFRQETRSEVCGRCGNNCQLTINTFADGGTFISGNRCERPVTGKTDTGERNLYDYKRKLILGYKPVPGRRGKIGLPLCLNMWELLPFWHTFFTSLGFAVYHSPLSSRELYLKGQGTIPSDTVCFPAKLAHGHIQFLSKLGLDAIFYPCMTYNIDEGLGDNHYNCPVVAYYPEVIAGNCPEVQTGGTPLIYDYVGLHRPKDFARKIFEILIRHFPDLTQKEVKAAADAAYAEYARHMAQIRAQGERIMEKAREEGRRIIVLAGRPYHVDPEINHGIDTLITQFGAAVVTEDSISHRVEKVPTTVLNQWTYHARLYAAAKYCCSQPDMDLVQLVSFGCGVDAITTDETREILQDGGKLYTQLKIDEITNLGAVRIRLRSLFAALEEEKEG